MMQTELERHIEAMRYFYLNRHLPPQDLEAQRILEGMPPVTYKPPFQTVRRDWARPTPRLDPDDPDNGFYPESNRYVRIQIKGYY